MGQHGCRWVSVVSICATMLLCASPVCAQDASDAKAHEHPPTATAPSTTTAPATTTSTTQPAKSAAFDLIRLFDDTTLTGVVSGLEGRTLKLSAGEGSPNTDVSLEDVVEISLQATTQPVATTKPGNPNGAAASLFGAVVRAISGTTATPPSNASAPKAPSQAKAGPKVPKPPAGAWQFVLLNGDLLFGKAESFADRKVVLKSASSTDALELPVDAIEEIWTSTPSRIAKARALGVKVDVQDVAFVSKDKDVVSVSGIVDGIDGDSLLFTFNDQQRRIALDRLVGIAFGGHDVESASNDAQRFAFHQSLAMTSGEMLSGQLKSIDDDRIEIQSPNVPAPVSIARNRVEKILIRNGRVVHLTDLQPAKVEQTPYFDRILPWRMNESLAGTPIEIQSGPVERGIALPSRTVLTFDVGGGFTTFQAKLGMQQPVGNIGRVAVRVLGDEKVLFENADVRGDQPPIDFTASVKGVKRLVLEVDFGQEQDVGDWAVFAEPKLLREAID